MWFEVKKGGSIADLDKSEANLSSKPNYEN